MNGVKYWEDEQPWLADYVDTDDPAKCAAVRAELARRTTLLQDCAGPESCNRTFGPIPDPAAR